MPILRFKQYVDSSTRTLTEIAESIGQSKQNCSHWTSRGTPVYVVVDVKNFETIREVFRKERLFPRKVAKTTKKVKRQIKRR